MADSRNLGENLAASLAHRYRIERELGRGGMAVVFLAEDLKHHRKVALKVLRPELVAVLGADRFLEEIEVTANLQHPNILPLYDSGEADGLLYYVMPIVQGESLRDRLDRERQLPVEEAVEIATAVAGALDYAHRQDVIHRDIKPSNILLHEGQALVSDFGVALALRRAGGDSRLTETGMSVGTPHYMSPEQAAGDRAVDARSDIYSLGATTYEMLVGEPPHVAKTPQAVVAKILSETPAPIRRTRDLVPPNVEAAVTKALARSPADRFRTGAELADALVDPGFTLPTLIATPVLADRKSRTSAVCRRAAWGMAALTLVVGILAAWGWLRTQPPKEVARYNLTFLPGQELVDTNLPSFAVAPGAAAIVYVGPGPAGTRLWVKKRAELAASPLPGTDGATLPLISPDGKDVTFWVETELQKISLEGGAPITLAMDAAPVGMAWMGDGTLVYSRIPGFRLHRISSSGMGEPQELWPDQPQGSIATTPTPLPDGRGLIFSLMEGVDTSASESWVLDFRSGQAKQLLPAAFAAGYSQGLLIFFLPGDGAAFAVPFDLDELEPKGDPVSVLEGVRVADGAPEVSVSRDGTVLMLQDTPGTAHETLELVWISRDGSVQPADADWRFHSARNEGWSLSPDGTRLAIGIQTEEGDDIWVRNLDTGSRVRLTHDPTEEARPIWSPDGGSVLFIHGIAGSALYLIRADGARDPVPIIASDSTPIWQADFSPSGDWIVARTGGYLNTRDIVGYALDRDTTEIPLVTSDYDEVSPQVSPDGRWLAYASQESGAWEVEVRPFPDVDADRVVVSQGGGHGPRWGHDPGELKLFYVSGNDQMMVARLDAGEGVRVTERETLFPIPPDLYLLPLGFSFDVTPDDQRFIMARRVSGEEQATRPPLVLVENWIEEARERVKQRQQGG